MLKRLLSLPILFSSVLFAQQPGKAPHTIRASGEATVSAPPDRAEISVAVSTVDETAEAAAAQNARQTTQVLDALKRLMKGTGALKTSGYSINAEYQYEQGQTPKLTGYRANNSVLATVDDLALVGQIIDQAALSGATSIPGVSFTLRDDAAVRSKALAEAAVKARASAEAIAAALNLKVLGVLDAQTNDAANVRPLPLMQSRVAAPNSTPIETGTLDVHASVVVTLEVQ
jgi:uncharacterized protein YggE